MTSGTLELFPKQQQFAEAVLSGRYNYLLYGGAIRGGKSVVALSMIILLCKVYPGSRWAIVRKDLPTLRRNTIPTFEKIKPRPFVGDINQSTWTARCTNESEIVFFPESLKQDPDHDRWKGLEVNGFKLGEANELSEATFAKAIERAGTWSVDGAQPPILLLMTCNPANNYVKRRFYDAWKNGSLEAPYFYLPANMHDNPTLTREYIESQENLKAIDPAAHARFVLGDWDSADDPRQLITHEWMLVAANVEAEAGTKQLGVDVARFGKDDSMLAHVDGNELTGLERYHGKSTTELAHIVQNRITEKPYDPARVKIDTVGLGAGVADNLAAEGFSVAEVIGGAKPIERGESFYRFKNLRSQIWWEFREGLRNGEYSIDAQALGDPKLIEDLTAPRYSISGDKVIEVESKDSLMRRLGRSPDAGDTVVYAFADIPAAMAHDFRLPDSGRQARPWMYDA